MNKNEFRKVTELLEKNYSKELDLEIFDLWYEEFKDYPIEIYKEIVKNVIRNEVYMPSLAKMNDYKLPLQLCVKVQKKKPNDKDLQEIIALLSEF